MARKCTIVVELVALSSMWGMTYVYNLLPQHVLNMPSVCGFQRCLTGMAKLQYQRSTLDDRLFCPLSKRSFFVTGELGALGLYANLAKGAKKS